jgi:hypothetical protein
MHIVAKSALLPVCAALLLAADPSWKTKDVAQWNEDEAHLLLTESPWVKKASPTLLPQQNEASRRAGGQWGGGQSAGLDALTPSALLGPVQPGKRRAKLGGAVTLEIRWESALPVRAAEAKTHDTDAPDWEGDLYAISVYDVPGLDINEKKLADELKRVASLMREGKKDLKPARVDLLPQVGGLTTVVYFFSRTEEITMDDKRIEFAALLGRLSLTQYFFTDQMQFRGKLEL